MSNDDLSSIESSLDDMFRRLGLPAPDLLSRLTGDWDGLAGEPWSGRSARAPRGWLMPSPRRAHGRSPIRPVSLQKSAPTVCSGLADPQGAELGLLCTVGGLV